MTRKGPKLYGLLAEYHSPREIIEAAKKTRAAGFRKVDAFTPYPIEDLNHALAFEHSYVPLITLIGGVLGCLGGFGLCYWSSVIEYPLNIGGRPFNSWPSFIPPTFECTILLAGFGAVFGMLALNGLPMPHHPVFGVSRFKLASRDLHFLCIEAKDPQFDAAKTAEFLRATGATDVFEVEDD